MALRGTSLSWNFYGTFTELYSQHLFVPPAPLHEKVPTISPGIEQVVLTALAKDSQQRFATVKAFATALEHASGSSAPREITVDTKVASQVGEPTTPTDPNSTKFAPRVINVDKNAAHPKAIAELKATGLLPERVELRQVKYLNNLVEQDHRFIKQLVKPGMGFFSVETAERTLHAHDQERTDARGEQRKRHGAGDLHRPPVWSGGLS